ncbi:MAG: EamA family transporter [Burkholderiales bacterium]|nr:EamA family transporter [Burkholderiales bacterium]
MSSAPARGDFAPVLICAFTYAFAVVCARIAFEDGSNTATVVLLRCAFAALAVGASLAIRPAGRVLAAADRNFILLLGVLFAVNVYAFYRSIEILRIPLAILIFYSYPLLTILFSAMAGLERMTPAVIACALLTLVGLALATGASPETLDPMGVALALGAGASIAFLLVVTTRRLGHVDARQRTFWTMVSTTVLLGLGMLAASNLQWPDSARGLLAIAGVCGFYAIGVVMLFASATRIGPARTATIMTLEPVIAIALSTALLGQGLTIVQLIGGLLVITGVTAAQWVRRAGTGD